MKTMRVVLACGVALVAVLDAASAQEHPGARSYARVCQACHGPQGQGDLAPALVPMAWETNYVMAIVREGYGQMPPISTRELDDQEVAQAVEYLRSVGETPAMQGGGYQGPRAADGHPDLSGIWQVINSASWNLEAHNAADGEPAGLGVVVGDTIPYQPWAATQQQENYENRLTADPMRQCFLAGVPRITYMPFPFQMIQTPDHMVITYELAHAVRIIYTDGSPHPLPNDFWMGDSRGRWDGDTLERYTPISPHHMTYEATIEDPEVFTALDNPDAGVSASGGESAAARLRLRRLLPGRALESMRRRPEIWKGDSR